MQQRRLRRGGEGLSPSWRLGCSKALPHPRPSPCSATRGAPRTLNSRRRQHHSPQAGAVLGQRHVHERVEVGACASAGKGDAGLVGSDRWWGRLVNA